MGFAATAGYIQAHGAKGIHPTELQGLAAVIMRPLSTTFQWSWESGEIPVDCKLTNAVPVFKKGGQEEDPGNYRPLGLSSAPGKITEKIVL